MYIHYKASQVRIFSYFANIYISVYKEIFTLSIYQPILKKLRQMKEDGKVLEIFLAELALQLLFPLLLNFYIHL